MESRCTARMLIQALSVVRCQFRSSMRSGTWIPKSALRYHMAVASMHKDTRVFILVELARGQ